MDYRANNTWMDREMRASLELMPDGTSVLVFENGDEEVNDEEVTVGLIEAYLAELRTEV